LISLSNHLDAVINTEENHYLSLESNKKHLELSTFLKRNVQILGTRIIEKESLHVTDEFDYLLTK